MKCKGCGRPLDYIPPTTEELDRAERLYSAAFTDLKPEIPEEQRDGLCEQCYVECTRLGYITALVEKPLTNREIVEIGLEQEAFVALMSDEQLEAHILDVKRKLERFRICALKAREEKTKREYKRMQLLSPEEIERLKRENALKRAPKVKMSHKPTEKERASAVEALVRAGVPRELAEQIANSPQD